VAHIRPGMKHNEKIIFKGEGDQSLQSPPEGKFFLKKKNTYYLLIL